MGLLALHRHLGAALQKVGLWHWVKPQYEPHVTLLYDDRRVAEQAVDTVGWTVREFVLVHSLHGQGRYVFLGRWKLAVGLSDVPLFEKSAARVGPARDFDERLDLVRAVPYSFSKPA